MANWDTREEIGLKPAKAVFTNVVPKKGIVCHYGGVGPFKRKHHADCHSIWRAWQAYHMSSSNSNDYVDIAYNLGVCHHGVILEGRSTKSRPKVRGGANGNYQVNTDRMSIVMIWGREDGEPTDLLKSTWLDARKFLMDKADAGAGIDPHNAFSQTACPGVATAWVKKGAPDPRGSVTSTPTPKLSSRWDGKSFPGTASFKLGVRNAAVTVLDKRLIAHGYTKHHDGDGYQAGPTFTTFTRNNVRDFQRDQGWRGKDADGYPGPVTWKRLMQAPKRKQPARRTKFPGRGVFKLGKRSKYVTLMDKRLIAKGFDKHHDGKNGYNPGPTFTVYTLRNVKDFQEAQGWSGSDADGYPGPVTWERLFK